MLIRTVTINFFAVASTKKNPLKRGSAYFAGFERPDKKPIKKGMKEVFETTARVRDCSEKPASRQPLLART